jgi:DNA-binding transcriptional LysR family regulator
MYIITAMQLDFNLLNALDALLEEGSVAGAAARLHLSQPAMSRTLGRIREVTRELLTPNRELDIAALKRTFTIRCNEVVATAIGARLIIRVHSLAPGVTSLMATSE